MVSAQWTCFSTRGKTGADQWPTLGSEAVGDKLSLYIKVTCYRGIYWDSDIIRLISGVAKQDVLISFQCYMEESTRACLLVL